MFCMFLRNLYKRSQTRSFHQLFRQTLVAILLSATFYSYALTSTTSDIIHGNAPYLTFDDGYTRATNTEGLLGITLSDGTKYTPSTNTSLTKPIELPVAGQSFADIGMLVPTNTYAVSLLDLISWPYSYWRDDDGDGDSGIEATGKLSLSIMDKNNQPVTRDTVLTVCQAPYQVKLTSTNGQLTTDYGIPNSSNYKASDVTYYVVPKGGANICFVKPNLRYGKLNEDGATHDFRGPATMWDSDRGFLTQSFYALNFPTTGANNLYFDLDIGGTSKILSWPSVSHGGITATMTDVTATSVRVTLTGPVATQSQWSSDNPGLIAKPILPQTFELVGRDSNGNAVVKYGFSLKQWFVNRGNMRGDYSNTSSWCNSFGYRMPKVKDLTNAACQGFNSGFDCQGSDGGVTPSSPNNLYQRRIGAGFVSEWGRLESYSEGNFKYGFWANESGTSNGNRFIVDSKFGSISQYSGFAPFLGICTYP